MLTNAASKAARYLTRDSPYCPTGLLGTISGVPVSGSSITRQRTPKTCSTSSASTTSAGAPRATTRPSRMRDQVGGVAAGLVEVVQDGDERAARGVQLRAQVEHLDLVLEVEERRRLVEQQQRRLLREHHRQPDALALAAGELVDRPVGEVVDAGGRHRALDGALVVARPLAQEALVRVAAAGDEVDDA